ncbi:hypothetical protein D915_005931 [Fasciola hepatica]|uniref:CD59-like protein n=1 Tax=Fasciola hepatica TaxID=6192 RepID=A0A4E0RA61_FASHE|nr:hypothetical protein D915_005931 [Fasciola hepatica]
MMLFLSLTASRSNTSMKATTMVTQSVTTLTPVLKSTLSVGLVTCYHCTPCSTDTHLAQPTHGNCKWCGIEEIFSGGNVTTTNRICGDQCRSYNNELNGYGGRLGCCQKEKCNVNWPTGTYIYPNWEFLSVTLISNFIIRNRT